MNGTFQLGMVYFVPYKFTKAQEVWGVPKIQSPLSNPLKGKLSNSLLGCANQKENKQKLVQIPAQGQSDS